MEYAVRRLASLLATLTAVSFLTFAAFDLISGSAATVLLGTQATEERLEALEEELGLNRPLPVRYAEWLAGFFTGHLGTSLTYRQEVGSLIAGKIQVTLLLTLVSFVLIVLVSLPLGLRYARSAGKPEDALHTVVNQFAMAVPPFFTGILLSYCFGIVLKWFMPGAFPGLGDLRAAFPWLFFAAVSIAVPRIAMTVRMLRGIILSEMEKDYVRTAIARGCTRGQVLRRHVLKNALCPVVSFLAQNMAEIVAGGVVVEQVFGIPGVGRMLVVSISNRDYPVVQAIVVLLAVWVVSCAAAADLINARIDPRFRLGEQS